MDVICGKLTMQGNIEDTKYGNDNLIFGRHPRFTFKKFVQQLKHALRHDKKFGKTHGFKQNTND